LFTTAKGLALVEGFPPESNENKVGECFSGSARSPMGYRFGVLVGYYDIVVRYLAWYDEVGNRWHQCGHCGRELGEVVSPKRCESHSIPSWRGYTAIEYKANNGTLGVVKSLEDRGMNLERTKVPIGAEPDRLEIITFLLDYGVCWNIAVLVWRGTYWFGFRRYPYSTLAV
jgi:hypothetical protein